MEKHTEKLSLPRKSGHMEQELGEEPSGPGGLVCAFSKAAQTEGSIGRLTTRIGRPGSTVFLLDDNIAVSQQKACFHLGQLWRKAKKSSHETPLRTHVSS